MKENSIKEDIKILEEMIENANIENMDMNDCFGGEHIEAIDHILSDYKRVLKENEELGKFIIEGIEIKTNSPYKNYSLEFLRNNFIPIQKVKDKIEDKIAEIEADKLNYGEDDWYLESELKGYAIDKLKELLESEDSKDGENKKSTNTIRNSRT